MQVQFLFSWQCSTRRMAESSSIHLHLNSALMYQYLNKRDCSILKFETVQLTAPHLCRAKASVNLQLNGEIGSNLPQKYILLREHPNVLG